MAGSDPTLQVAFFRNLNLGQARSKSPTSDVLRSAFTAAGATSVANFQTNGTVVFATSRPDIVVTGVRAALAEATGYTDAVVVRPAGWVCELGARLDPTTVAGEVSLFDAADVPAVRLPWQVPDSALVVLELDGRHAVTGWESAGVGSGANPLLTRMLGVPVTCRGIPTMIRLAARLRALSGQPPGE